MTKEQFIEKIAPIIVKYALKYNVLCPSAVIAQAVLESNGGMSELAVNAHNYFGLKYRAGRCPTSNGIYHKIGSEQDSITGLYVSSAMQWFKFPSMDTGVIGYFDFTNISNYKSIKGLSDPKTYLENIKKAGYATSIKYVDNLMAVINKYNLTRFDPKENNKEVKPMGSNSPLVTYTKISPNRTSPRNHKIDCITIHCIVGQWTAKQGCDYFATTGRSASANYVVGKDGSIGLSVPESDRSWCSSNAANDHRAVTIEVASDTTHPYTVTSAAMKALIELCADICKRNGIKKLVWSTNKNERINHLNGCNMTVHRDFASKACPGEYLYSKHGYIANEVNKRLGVSTGGSSTSTTTSSFIYNGYDYSLVFNPTYYANKYSDLKKAFGTDSKKLFFHFVTYGMKEGRIACSGFNVQAYKNRYSDLQKAFGSNLPKYYEHYIKYGFKEKRQAT